jgi:hypothetical protein
MRGDGKALTILPSPDISGMSGATDPVAQIGGPKIRFVRQNLTKSATF